MTCRLLTLGVLLLCLPLAAGAQIERLLAEGEARANEGARAQQRVDAIADQTLDLVAEYRSVTKVIDGLNIYNSLLQRQIDRQEEELQNLEDSIQQVSLIERQILPLMVRMIDGLEDFIRLDTPFLAREREARIERLRETIERTDVTAAEKFRIVLEAYSIENDYGRNIEAYKGSVDLEGRSLEVDFLRIGRVALAYQTADREITGAWNSRTNDWETLPPEQYKQQIARGLAIARKEVAPDLIIVPVSAPEAN